MRDIGRVSLLLVKSMLGGPIGCSDCDDKLCLIMRGLRR